MALSCTKESHPRPVIPTGTDGISFSAEAADLSGWSPLSKAVDVTDSYLQTNGFGVYAYYTGADNYTGASDVDGVVMNDRKVTYAADYKYNVLTSTWTATGSNAWIYYGQNYYGTNQPAYKEYWPMKDGEKITFFAYAPYNIWNSTNGTAGAGKRVNVSEEGAVPTIPYQLFKSGDTGVSVKDNNTNYTVTVQNATFGDGIQRDILWGVQSTGYPYKNFTRPEKDTEEHVANTVNFRFRHALSKIRFNVLTEDVPSVSETALYQFDNRAVLESVGTQTNYFGENPHKTVFLIESVRIYSSDGLLANSGTLSLDNTTHADQPEWSDKSGKIIYAFGNNVIDTKVLYVTNNNSDSSVDNNPDKFSTLISRRTTLTGLNSTPYNLQGNASNYFYALPGSGNLTVEVKYHKITLYYHRGSNYYSRYWSVYDGNDISEPLTRTFAANFEAGRRYDMNLVLQGNEMELQLEVQPWELNDFSYEITDADYAVIEGLTFDSDYIDYRIDDKVYINNRVGKFTFKVNGNRYLYWRASLIGDKAFCFTDKNGAPLLDTEGEYISMFSGELNKDVRNEIYIKATDPQSTTMNKARLRLYFYYRDGADLRAKVPLNLIEIKTSGGDPIQEWTVVQNAN